MRESWALAAVAILTLMASLGTLVPVFADLTGQPLAGWKRGRRAFVATALLIISSITGYAAYRAALPTPPVIVPPSPDTTATNTVGTDTIATDTIATDTIGTDTIATDTARTETTATIQTETVKSHAFPPVPKPSTPRIAIRDEHGRSVAQLVRVAQHLSAKGYSVEGDLQEESEQSTELEGMYTVYLTLNVAVTSRGAVATAFTVNTRGGGFQRFTARTQAMERLAADFAQRLSKEIP
jgi:hypothetical protein